MSARPLSGSGFGSGFGSAPTSPPPNNQAPTTTTTTTTAPTPHANPKVAELQTMFPTVDGAVVELVLESVGGSQDRAIEQLLSMTDENFRPEVMAAGRREAESQVDLDEAFARSLALQDQQRSERYSAPHSQPQSGHTNPGAGGLPYQPRIKRSDRASTGDPSRPPPPGSATDVIYSAADAAHGGDDRYRPVGVDERYQDRPDGQPQGRDGMLAVEQKLEQFAEVGKQTFTSLLSKAKAKYAEYQQSQGQPQGQGQAHGQGQYQQGNPQQYAYGEYGQNSHTGVNGGNVGSGYNQPQQYGEESAAGWGRSGSTPGGGRGGMQNWQQAGQGGQGQGQHSSRSTSFSSESTADQSTSAASAPKPVLRQSSGRWQPTDTYDDPTPPVSATSPQNRIDLGGGGVGGRRSPGGLVGSPEKTTGGAKIDASKLGLLPKKKVDLLSSSPGGSTTNLAPGHTAGSASTAGAGTGANAGTAFGGEHADHDPNPALPSAKASIISKIPATPPAGARGGRGYEDSDDELEYTRNPFDEK